MPPRVRDLIAELEAAVSRIVEARAVIFGSAPGLILGGCHGDDEQAVFEELCQIVDEAIALYERDGKPLPPPTSGRDFANRMQRVV